MRIERVELKNIKPFASRSFDFSEGVNVLCGQNGTGKSTVFEAIGYALFGVPPSAFVGKAERFVRKGQRRGEVRVHFALEDGRRFVVERHAGTSSRWQLFRRDGDRLDVVDTKSADELEGELKRLLAIKLDQPLADQFLNVVGPLQSDFFGPFVRKGRSRTDEFEKILGIDGWREAFGRSREMEKAAEARIARCRERVAWLREQTSGYDAVAGALAEAEAALAATREEHERAGRDLAEARAAKLALDAARDLAEASDRAAGEARLRMARAETELEVERALLEKARVAEKHCADTLADHQAYLSCERELEALRERQSAAAAVRERLNPLERRIAAEESALAEARARLDEAAARLERDSGELAAREAELEADVARLAEEGSRAAERAEAAARWARALDGVLGPGAGRRLAELVDAVARAEAGAAALRPALGGRDALAAEAAGLDALTSERSALAAELARLAAERSHVEESARSLRSGVCPLLAEPCGNIGDRAPDEFFADRLAALSEPAGTAEARAAEVDAAVARARAARQQLEALGAVAARLAAAERRAEEARESLRAALEPLGDGSLAASLRLWLDGAPEEVDTSSYRRHVEALEPDALAYLGLDGRAARDADTHAAAAASEALDDAARALASQAARDAAALAEARDELRSRWRSTADRRADARDRAAALGAERARVDGERAEVERRAAALAELSAERFALRSALEEYAGIDAQIDDFARRLKSLRSGHERYVEYSREARNLPVYAMRAEEMHAALEAARREVARLEAELAAAAAGYDRAAHEAAERALEEASGRESEARHRIERLEEELERGERERRRLAALREEMERVEAESAGYESTLAVVEALRRDVFNRVGERLSDRYRADISARADRIYRRIAHADEELRWGEGFRVELVDFVADDKGRTVERVRYDEELSGGQRMSAVVALRLALLQSTGATIGLFDEPTSNLDASRRARLAEAFRSLDENRESGGRPWYTQLFLVSHDVAFSEITDHTTNLDAGAKSL